MSIGDQGSTESRPTVHGFNSRPIFWRCSLSMKPSPRSGVSAERRWLLFPRIAALCQDAATPGFIGPNARQNGVRANLKLRSSRRKEAHSISNEGKLEPPYVGCYAS